MLEFYLKHLHQGNAVLTHHHHHHLHHPLSSLSRSLLGWLMSSERLFIIVNGLVLCIVNRDFADIVSCFTPGEKMTLPLSGFKKCRPSYKNDEKPCLYGDRSLSMFPLTIHISLKQTRDRERLWMAKKKKIPKGKALLHINCAFVKSF